MLFRANMWLNFFRSIRNCNCYLWQKLQRIIGASVKAYFKMHMRAGRVSGHPNFPDNLALLHFIIFMHKVFLVVCIHGHNAVGMLENDHIAIAALLSGISNLTIQNCLERSSFRAGDIESFMGLSITCAESRSDLSCAGPNNAVFLKFGLLNYWFGNYIF